MGSLGEVLTPEVLAEASVAELYGAIEQLLDAEAVRSTVGCSDGEVLAVVRDAERVRRKFDGAGLRRVQEVADRSLFRVAGRHSEVRFWVDEMRLGSGEARRRIDNAAAVVGHRALTGEPLDPELPCTAVAVGDGEVSAEHVEVIRKTMHRIPVSVAADLQELAERQLAAAARELPPAKLATVGLRLLGHLDPDGRHTDHRDRQRQRGLSLGPQDSQGMSRLTGFITPELRAILEVILTEWAAPGSNNPDVHGEVDQVPRAGKEFSPTGTGDGTGDGDDPAVVDGRSPSQRRHDAVVAMGRFVLGHGGLGKPNRIPCQLVITAELKDLRAGRGFGLTATGTTVPIDDLVALAVDADPYLEVFADGTKQVLYFGSGRRLASFAQRLAIFGRDRGCSRPGCGCPFAYTEMHHAVDAAKGGPTDIDNLTAACGPDNRAAGDGPGQWSTRPITAGPDAGLIGWRANGDPDPRLRTNRYHRGLGA